MAKQKKAGRPKKMADERMRQMNVNVPKSMMDQLEQRLKIQSFGSYVRVLIENDLKQQTT